MKEYLKRQQKSSAHSICR